MPPSIFAFSGFSDVIQSGILKSQAHLLHLWLLQYSRHTRLAHTRFFCPTFCRLPPPWFFMLEDCSVFSGRSWARLLGVSLALFGALYLGIHGAVLVALTPINHSQYVFSIGLGWCLHRLLFLVPPWSRFILCFHYVAPARRVYGIPCSSRLLFFWRLSGALALHPIIWQDP